MERSAGIICLRTNENQELEFLVCTPGGPYWKNRECWSFPKGHIEEGETVIEAAVREFNEETGIALDKSLPLAYFGRVKQNSKKSVDVFVRPFGEEYLDDVSNMHSNMFICELDGKEYPEIGKYAWMTYDEIKNHDTSKVYLPLYEALTELNRGNETLLNKWINEHNSDKNTNWIKI